MARRAKVDLPQLESIFQALSAIPISRECLESRYRGPISRGSNADAAERPVTGHFPDSQDQRNTVRARICDTKSRRDSVITAGRNSIRSQAARFSSIACTRQLLSPNDRRAGELNRS